MARRNDRPTKKVTMYLHDEDWQRLKEYYPRVGASAMVRVLILNHIRGLRAGEPALNLDPEEIKP